MILENIIHRSSAGEKLFVVLVDPDKYNDDSLFDLANSAKSNRVSYFFVGGSLMTSERLERTVDILKDTCDIPVIIFPGSNLQICDRADAILFLSLISGRNPEFLIGQHVVAAPYIKKAGLEVLPTGYMLIEGEKQTTANYMSNTLPIPKDKPEIAACTAMAGEMLGMKMIYMDGGSGALGGVPLDMISQVKSSIDLPIIVGGGVVTAQQAGDIWKSGADVIVVGNAIEKDLGLIESISQELKSV